MKQGQKTLVLWLVFGLFALTLWSLFGKAPKVPAPMPFSELIASIDEGRVKDITISGQTFAGQLHNGTNFRTTGVLSDSVLKRLDSAHQKYQTVYTISEKEVGGFWMVLVQWLPMLLIIGFFIFFMRQLQSGGGRAMSFGKSKAKMLSENNTKKVTFDDVAGVDECKQELEEIVHFLKNPKKYTRLGGRIPKGVLLMGPPGTGKTLLARAVAGEAGVPFFSIAGSDFVEMFVGVGASRVRDLFEQGKRRAPCIIFIDEIDAVGRQRGAGMGGGHDEREQTLNQLLVEMDGFESSEGVIIIAATNRPDVLDPAILRPGRFDRRVMVPKPDLLGREAIAKVHLANVPTADDVNIGVLARSTPGMSGADIENLVNEAALLAARDDKEKVEMIDFELAREKIMMGAERKTMVLSRKDVENTAYHEAGHALVSSLMPSDADPVHKVSIIPRGQALGVTMQLPTQDRYSMSKTFAENQIAILMGGRLAEVLIFDELTSGAGNDFERASDIASSMVCDWGMSELGPLVFGKKQGEIFLGRDFSQSTNYSETVAKSIDAEVRRIVEKEYARAENLIKTHMDELHKIAKALLKYETIDGFEVRALIKGEEITREAKTATIRTHEDIIEQKEAQGDFKPEKAGVSLTNHGQLEPEKA